MKTLTLHLPDEIAAQVDEAARKLGITAEELARAGVEEKLERLQISFDEAAQHVLKKNDELYRRLA